MCLICSRGVCGKLFVSVLFACRLKMLLALKSCIVLYSLQISVLFVAVPSVKKQTNC